MEIPGLVGIKQDPDARPYYVVIRTLTGPAAGVLTFSTHESQDDYARWYAGKMHDGRPISQVYATVAEGVSINDAVKLCDNAGSLELLLEAAREKTATISEP